MSRRSAFDDASAASVVNRLVSEATDALEREEAKAAGKKLDGRGKPGHAGQVGRDKTHRTKASYDLSLNRQQLVRDLAAAEGVAQSDVVELAIQLVHEAWQAGRLDFYRLRRPARSLRAEWKLDIPAEIGLFRK